MAAIDRLAVCMCAGVTPDTDRTAAPTFFPVPGDYDEPQTVTIASTTIGALIFYTLNGANPDSGSTPYTGPVDITFNLTLKAIAIAAGYDPSTVTSGAYDVEPQVVSTPTFSPAAGDYPTSQSVTISTVTPLAQIFYTDDGSAPTALSTPYTAPVLVDADVTLKAIAILAGMLDSEVGTAAYTISPVVSTPTITPTTDTVYEYIFDDEVGYPRLLDLHIQTSTIGAYLVYNFDGDTWRSPTDGDGASYTIEDSEVHIPTTSTVPYKVRAFTGGIYSAVAQFYIAVEPPVFWGWSAETVLTEANLRSELLAGEREAKVNFTQMYALYEGDPDWVSYGFPADDYSFNSGGTVSDYAYLCFPNYGRIAIRPGITTIRLAGFDISMAGDAEGYTENEGNGGPNYMIVTLRGIDYKVYRTLNQIGNGDEVILEVS